MSDSLYLDEAAWAAHCATAYFGKDLDDADEGEGRRPRARAAARKDEYREDVERGRLIFDDVESKHWSEADADALRAEQERFEGYAHGLFGRDFRDFAK